MKKVLFICLGNICRSPMAEMVFKDIVNQKGLTDQFYIDSMATTNDNELLKAGIYQDTKDVLTHMNIPFTEHRSKQMHKEDYDKFDYIIGMDSNNVRGILSIIESDPDNKVYRLLDFTNNPYDIVDPWPNGDFMLTYKNIKDGCEKLFEYIYNNEML